MDAKVADANAPDFTIFDCLDQRFPGTKPALGSMIRRVQKIQIDVFKAGPLQALVDAPLGSRIVDELGRNLGSIEELFSRDTGAKQALGRRFLVAVSMRAVNVAVSGLDGVLDDILCDGCRAGDGISSCFEWTSNLIHDQVDGTEVVILQQASM